MTYVVRCVSCAIFTDKFFGNFHNVLAAAKYRWPEIRNEKYVSKYVPESWVPTAEMVAWVETEFLPKRGMTDEVSQHTNL